MTDRTIYLKNVSALQVLRLSAPLLIGAVCLWLVAGKLDQIDLTSIPHALSQISLWQWSVALAATGVSFWALGRYDIIFHRMFHTAVPDRSAMISGAAAIGLSQTLGMGLVTGALVRWRLLPDVSAVQASQITLGVSLSFLVCLAGLIGAAGLITGGTVLGIGVSLSLLVFCLVGVVLCLVQSAFRLRGRALRLPSARAAVRLLGLTALDTAAAALALYVLLPAPALIDWSTLYAIYLLALGAALLSGTPGGVGPFELVLITTLPGAVQSELLISIVAFRLVYYALPSLAALVVLIQPSWVATSPTQHRVRPVTETDLQHARRAELGVCRQNGAYVLHAGSTDLAVVQTAQTCTALFDPITSADPAMFDHLAHYAKQHHLTPLFYKASARVAAMARQSGWHVCHIADEAVVIPARYSIEDPACRQLRRKLRKAEKAGLNVTLAKELPLARMALIDEDWQAVNGPARGLSMGRFDADYLQSQRVYIARQGPEIVGFISLHDTPHESCLDLMRVHRSAPQGTVQALVHEAILNAAHRGVPRVSLAAMALPEQQHPATRVSQILIRGHGRGLRQFKSSFAPAQEPLYALAPSRFALALGVADIALSIRAGYVPKLNVAQHFHEEKAFARPPQM